MLVVFNRRKMILPAGVFWGIALALLTISGCGGKQPEIGDSRDDQATTDDSAAEIPEESPKPRKTGKGKKGKKESQAHIGEIPKDAWPEIWFKDPLAVAGEAGSAEKVAAEPAMVQSEETAPNVAEKQDPPAEKSAPKGASEGAGWSSLITGEVLSDETKALKNKLKQQLQDPGRYNSTYQLARVDATVLAVLAAIAPEVPDSPGWKTNAKFVRDLASSVAAESKANGDKFYRKAKESYDKLDAVLGGNKPPDVKDAADTINFSEIAERRYLMQQMERTKNWMKSDVNSEAAFKKESGRLTQEASVLSVLAKVITTPDYTDHDLDEYKRHADTVSQSSHDIVAAVQANDYKAYLSAIETYRTACDKCHEAFKN